jgi:hypothetical protein
MDVNSEYITDWETVCKIVSHDKIQSFNDLFDSVAVAVKLSGEKMYLDNFLIYYYTNSLCVLEEYKKMKPQIDKLKDMLKDIFVEFEQITKIPIKIDYEYDTDNWEDDEQQVAKIVLDWSKVVQYTPQANKLVSMGGHIRRSSWVDFL